MKLVRENIEFKRGSSVTKALDIGRFKNQIDWDNLPEHGIWRVITPDNECIIDINPMNFYMIKNWMDDDNNEEWAPAWRDYNYVIDESVNLKKWLIENGAFNLIRFIQTTPGRPGWDTLAEYPGQKS